MQRAIPCLARKQEITFCCITPKMLTSCPCNGGLSKKCH
jgi:hypothetical protein